MTYRRSPRYPAVSLQVAVNGAHLLGTKDTKTAVPGEVLAKALGYKSHSGPARTLIGALRQYGLLEKQGSGMRLSASARLIISSYEGSEEHATAIWEAALAPHLFRELHATHRGAPEGEIKSYLTLRRGFTELGAALAVSAYQDTLSFAKLTFDDNEVLTRIGRKSGDSLLTQTLVVSIPRNFKVDVSIHGDRIGKADLARIKYQLDRWLEGLEEAFE
jgi:hypothetical protein